MIDIADDESRFNAMHENQNLVAPNCDWTAGGPIAILVFFYPSVAAGLSYTSKIHLYLLQI